MHGISRWIEDYVGETDKEKLVEFFESLYGVFLNFYVYPLIDRGELDSDIDEDEYLEEEVGDTVEYDKYEDGTIEITHHYMLANAPCKDIVLLKPVKT